MKGAGKIVSLQAQDIWEIMNPAVFTLGRVHNPRRQMFGRVVHECITIYYTRDQRRCEQNRYGWDESQERLRDEEEMKENRRFNVIKD